MANKPIAAIYRGWWRIVDTTTWGKKRLDLLGPALISFTGEDDRLRMLALLAHPKCMSTDSGIAFMWQGAWEFDQMTGRGQAQLGNDGRLNGEIAIDGGDDSEFIAERTVAPAHEIQDPPSYRDKWRRFR
jgi:hypothetical protein